MKTFINVTKKISIPALLLLSLLLPACAGTPAAEVATPTKVAAEATEIVQPTATSVPPTATPVPPTATPVPPTDTPVPPTDTPTPKPTDTPAPTDTPTPKPTDTPEPPTSTPTPAPTNTPSPTPMPTATIDADPTVHDNFNNPAFDGSINSGRWEQVAQDTGCSIQQQDGKVIFLSNGSSNSSGCWLDADSALATEVGALEAIVYTEPGATGNYSVGSVQFGTVLSSGTYWYATCGIFQNPNDGWLTAGLTVGTISNSGEFGEEYRNEIEGIAYGQWHKFRIQLDPTTMDVSCYLNDALIASHIPEEAGALKNSEMGRSLNGFWSENTQTTYYFDDVRIFPSTP